jgi:hypothetical protein
VGIYCGGVALGMFHWSEADVRVPFPVVITWAMRLACAACAILLIAPGGAMLAAGLALTAAAAATGPLWRVTRGGGPSSGSA